MIKHVIKELNSVPLDLTYTGPVDPWSCLSIQNIATSGYAYLGSEDLSASNYGHKLYPGQSFTIELAPNDKLFAIGDVGVSVAVFKLDIG